jgi:hypothetical protein
VWAEQSSAGGGGGSSGGTPPPPSTPACAPAALAWMVGRLALCALGAGGRRCCGSDGWASRQRDGAAPAAARISCASDHRIEGKAASALGRGPGLPSQLHSSPICRSLSASLHSPLAPSYPRASLQHDMPSGARPPLPGARPAEAGRWARLPPGPARPRATRCAPGAQAVTARRSAAAPAGSRRRHHRRRALR